MHWESTPLITRPKKKERKKETRGLRDPKREMNGREKSEEKTCEHRNSTGTCAGLRGAENLQGRARVEAVGVRDPPCLLITFGMKSLVYELDHREGFRHKQATATLSLHIS